MSSKELPDVPKEDRDRARTQYETDTTEPASTDSGPSDTGGTRRRKFLLPVGAAALAAVFLFGWLQTATTPTLPAMDEKADTPTSSSMSMHEQHHGGASVIPASEADYLVDMIPHHEEAIRAARQLLAGTEREEMREFARRIIDVQQSEVDTMRRWLSERHPTVDRTSTYMAMMGDYQGMTGDQIDRAFLEDMIPHHMTAVMMSQQLVMIGISEHDDVPPFAETIARTQSSEIQEMSAWLQDWFGVAYGSGMMHSAMMPSGNRTR